MDKGEDNWPDPTPEMLKSPEFEAVWDLIKTWEIKTPKGDDLVVTGRHVRAILDSIKESRPRTAMEIIKVLQYKDPGGRSRMNLIDKLGEMLSNTVI